MQAAHQPWEYQVIRLNIEPPVAEGPQQDKPQSGGPMFSEAYLKEEFPRFYDNSPAAKQAAEEQARQADPAFEPSSTMDQGAGLFVGGLAAGCFAAGC